MEVVDKIVDFDKYCDICKFKDYSEETAPCCDCLSNPVNRHSSIPTEFKKSERIENKKRIQKERKVLQSKSRMRMSSKRSKNAVVDSNNIMGKIKEMQSK